LRIDSSSASVRVSAPGLRSSPSWDSTISWSPSSLGHRHASSTWVASGHDVTAIDPVAPEGPIFERVTLEEFAPSDPFDVVVTSRSLHHVPDLDLALGKIAQLAPLLIVEEFVWDRLDEQTAAWYLAHLQGPSKSTRQYLRDWAAEHAGLHGYETLRTGLDRHFRERFFAWCPYLHRYPDVDAGQTTEQALVDAGSINALAFRYVGVTDRASCRPV
jgi:Methyltransferase domain